jgi:type IV secretion system protein VirD4
MALSISDEPPWDGVSLGYLDENGSVGPMVWHTGEGSLVTIAPPGAGKGQAHIIPNLLTYDGPAIVLDIKGENYDLTHKWRSENVGPVYKFAPFDKDSHCYNPLDFLRTENQDSLWDDARLAASMLMVPSPKPDFWDSRARDLLTAILSFNKKNDEKEKQNMQTVLDYLYPNLKDLKDLEAQLKQSPFKPLKRTGNIFSRMPEKQKEGIFDSVRQHVDIWQSGRIEKVTRSSDWAPADFWEPPWKTLYISIPVGMVTVYASVIRIILGQHIQGLIESAPTPKEREKEKIPPVLFLIDEMPQLGYMEPIPYAIEVGRSYGLRLWMFAQSMGQIIKTYPDGKGLMEMCYAQCFMNPEFETAKYLSERLGMIESKLRNRREKVSEPQELMGKEFSNKILLFTRGEKPAKLFKVMAHQIDFLIERMGDST